ncbi:hypothetical protein ABEV77_03845 [Bacillus subtilis]
MAIGKPLKRSIAKSTTYKEMQKEFHIGIKEFNERGFEDRYIRDQAILESSIQCRDFN